MNEDELRAAHDRFVKFAFSNIENSRGLLSRVLPVKVLAQLDLATLELMPGTFVDSELRERLTDLLFQVSLKNGETSFVYILFDHKSSPDSLMPFKMLRYMVRIWEQRLRNNEQLSPIIPLILYHGEKSWDTSRTMQDIVRAPEELSSFVPHFDSILADLSQYTDDDLRENALYAAVLQVLKYIGSDELPERLPGILELFVQILDEPHGIDCLKAVLVYLSNATDKLNRSQLTEAIHHAFITAKSNKTESDSPMPTIAEQLKQEGRREGRREGRQEGRQEGREEGREEGLRAGISVVLEIRFPEDARVLRDQLTELQSTDLLTKFLGRCKSAQNAGELAAYLREIRQP